MNALGTAFRVEIYGESHGSAVGVIVDGCPPGLPLSAEDLEPDLARRRAGASGTTPRHEADIPEILSGLYRGHTTGSPLHILFRNSDTRSADYSAFAKVPRPGHADFTSMLRYRGHSDPRGSGHFSGRITAGLVAAGAIAKRLLPGVSFSTRLLSAGGREDVSLAAEEAALAGDSIGGLVELRVRGLPAGLGDPFFSGVEALASHALFSVPGVRGVEFGDGFAAAAMRGSLHNDPIVTITGTTSRNGAGGVNGGITNGNELVCRVAMKPASSIALPQTTIDLESGRMTTLEAKGRHDACIALRAAVVLEASLAIVLADLAIASASYDFAQPSRERP